MVWRQVQNGTEKIMTTKTTIPQLQIIAIYHKMQNEKKVSE